jgi:hypothetical protein
MVEALRLDAPADEIGWILALAIAGVFLLIVAVFALWLRR